MSNEIQEQSYSILLVDDDVNKVKGDGKILRGEGFQVYTAYSGEEGIEIIKSTPIDILIIDYYMGENLNGEETVMKIREFNTEIVIILQTGFAQELPALKMLKSLKIQGYYDKADGSLKLRSEVLSAVRSCEQIREVKAAMEKVRLTEERLIRLGKIMGAMFHDLSNPLAAIRSNLERINSQSSSIVDEANDSSDNEPSLDQIKNSAKEIEGICNSCEQRIKYIFDMRRNVIEQSREDSAVVTEKFLISDLIERVKFFAEADVKQYRCRIDINNQAPESSQLLGQKVNLIQALGNLITNSAQAYKEKNGKIELNVTEKDGFIKFSVKDWAGGIAPQIKEKLFSKMVTTKEDDGGSGVGIFSTYATVTNYFDGKMWFDSVEGEGVTFYISIPCAK